MFPLSFKEYMKAVALVSGTQPEKTALFDQVSLFQTYLENSSFPEVFAYADSVSFPNKAIREYLADIYNSILVRDVMTHEGVKELPQLNRVINFMFSNIGNETSINNMMGVINNEFKLRPQDKTLYAPMIEVYLKALLDSFLFYKADVQHFGKELLRTNAKYYAIDAGLRYYLLGGAPNKDAGHMLENVVYLELLRRGYKVEVGKVKTRTGDMEIDFVAQKDGGKVEYYQVAQSVMDEATLARELAPLEAIRDNHPKFILTRDTDNNEYAGIQHLNTLKWLLD
jgi:predicted AAA+ superfamily ATPase